MADLLIRILSKFDSKGFKQGEQGVKSFKSELAGLAKLGAGAFATKEIIAFNKENLRLAREQAAAEAQLDAALKSTGAAAGLTSSELKNLASELQGVTNFGDEATIAAESLLLTFTKIGRDAFPDAIRLSQDLSARFGTDLNSSILQVGKALNDPIQGVTALRRVGVSFSEAQREQIENFVKTNQLAKAQAVILKELETEVGGSAKAARDADGGVIALSNSFGDLREQLGFLIQDLNKATGATEEAIGIFDSLTNALRGTRAELGFGTVADEIAGLEQELKGLKSARDQLEAGGGPLTSRILAALGLVNPEEDIAFVDKQIADIEARLADAKNRQTDEEKAGGDDKVTVEEETDTKLLDMKRDFASDVLDIQRETNENLSDEAERFADALADSEEDHQERIADIRKQAAKQLVKIQRDLEKDLAKEDADLKKNLAKAQKSEDNRIADFQKKQAVEEKRQRRIEKVDALADERLFQFQLRQLAAEGEGNAIKAALEKRAIEEQIAKEKADVEQQIEDEKAQETVQSIRDEGAERRQQMILDSQERKALIEERNKEEIAAVNERIAEQEQDENESFAKRQADLQEYHDERLAQIHEGEQEAVAELAKNLTEVEDMTEESLQGLASVARQFGEDVGSEFAKGITEAYKKNQEIENLIGGAAKGGIQPISAADRERIQALSGGGAGFQNEGFVTGSFGIAHQGEVVLNPNNQGSLGGGVIQIGGQEFIASHAARLAEAINGQRQRDLQGLVDRLAEMMD